jgi:hypothetical protein
MSLHAQYVVGAVATLVVGGAIFWWAFSVRHGMTKRRRALQAFADVHGMTYQQYAGTLGALGQRFRLLHRGDMRLFMNVLAGNWDGIPVVVADYWYGSGPATPTSTRRRRIKGSSQHLSLAVLGVNAHCSHVAIDRQSMPITVAQHLGLQDIPFESEAFDRLFRVRATDPEFATALVDPRMMAWLLATGGDYGFEVISTSALVYGQFVEAPGIPALLDTAVGFVRHIPVVITHAAGELRPADPSTAPSPIQSLAEANAEAERELEAEGTPEA